MRSAALFGLLTLASGAVGCVPAGSDAPRYTLQPRATDVDAGPQDDSGAPLIDAGGFEDAAALIDAGSLQDAQANLDSGGPDDASTPADAGGPADAGSPQDSGAPGDSGTPTDSGAPVDAGPPDSGPPPDAGQPDAGSALDVGPIDSGAPLDAGSVPITGARGQTALRKRHIYSQLQAWSYDGVYYLTVDLDTSEGVIYHAGTWQEQARLSRIGHRWITGTHQILMFDDNAGNGAELYSYDIDTGIETPLMNLGHPGLRSGRSHEEVDRSGRYVAVYIDQPTSGGPRIVTADLWTRQVAADVSIAQIGCNFEPDWVGVDPSGQYLLVQAVGDGVGTCRGLWAHNILTGAAVRQITTHHNHGTTGVGPTGRPYFLSTELTHPNDNGSPGIYRYWIDTGTRDVVGAPLPWGALEHASCLAGPGEPCMASASNQFSTSYTGQVWRLDFNGTRTIVEPHASTGCADYWAQPQATVGPGGRFAYTTTNGAGCNQIRDVVVQ